MSKKKDTSADEAPVAEEPAVDTRDAELAALRDELAEIRQMIKAGAVNVVEASQEKQSRREQDEIKAWISQGKEKITQDECFRQFPDGKHRFICELPDGNGHPKISVNADNEVDAAGRYKAVCGIKSSEREVQVVRA